MKKTRITRVRESAGGERITRRHKTQAKRTRRRDSRCGSAGEIVSNALEINRAMGDPAERPVVVGTDSTSNHSVATRRGAPQRVKHALRRWFNFHQRVLAKQVHLVHVPGAQIPADFLTKWVTKQKYYDSLNYLTNSVNKVIHPNAN